MAYNEKDLFLILTVVCLLGLIYVIRSVWRSSRIKPKEPIQTKRIERFHRPEPSPQEKALPKVPRREPHKETPRVPHAVLLINETGSVIATARAIRSDLVISLQNQSCRMDQASLQVLGQYFPLSEYEGFTAYRFQNTENFIAKSMTIFDQKGDVLIQTIPIDVTVKDWPEIESYDLQSHLLREVEGLYRREFLDHLAWRAQFFCLRLELSSIEDLLHVPLQSTLKRPLTLLLMIRLLQTNDHWTKCRIFNRLNGVLDEISFENQFDGANLKQRINLHLFAISQTKATTPCFFKNHSIQALSI